MKTIGLLGGMSWQSTALYYQHINEGIQQQLGGLHSAKIVMVSVDFQAIERLQHLGHWHELGDRLATHAQGIQSAGADCLLICTNTMHKVADQVQAAIHIPLLHLADATAQTLVNQGIQKAGLLATAFTMEQDFYIGRLRDQYGLEISIPNARDRAIIHRVIYEELCAGIIKDSSRREYLRIMQQLKAEGAQVIIQGCTEITLLVTKEHTDIPLFDTTAIHVEKAVQYALDD